LLNKQYSNTVSSQSLTEAHVCVNNVPKILLFSGGMVWGRSNPYGACPQVPTFVHQSPDTPRRHDSHTTLYISRGVTPHCRPEMYCGVWFCGVGTCGVTGHWTKVGTCGPPAPLRLRPYGAIQICLLLFIFLFFYPR